MIRLSSTGGICRGANVRACRNDARIRQCHRYATVILKPGLIAKPGGERFPHPDSRPGLILAV